MMLEFTPIDKPQTDRKPFEIKLNGKTIGTLEPNQTTGWHAVIPIKNGWRTELAQGFAETHEEAVRNAIADGLKHHETIVASIQQLQAELSKESS